MEITKIAKIRGGQDGAIFGSTLIRFDSKGNASVYDISSLDLSRDNGELSPIAEFTLDKVDILAPHSNSVVFGAEYFAEGDEFPLLYTNIYNTYAKAEDKMCGVCAVYRIIRDGKAFSSRLVGIIEIGFTDDRELWRSAGEVADIRPYGNFVIDTDAGKYWAYVMRDGDRKTRFFRFALPSLLGGKIDERFGVPRVVLTPADIEESFDTPYHNYMQGAVCYKGKIYEVEGFGKDVRSAIRIIDLSEKREELYFDFYEAGFEDEPEFIDFFRGECIYVDAHGNLFHLSV